MMLSEYRKNPAGGRWRRLAVMLPVLLGAVVAFAADEVMQRAAAGDAEAQNIVGERCYDGTDGQERNHKEALRWWAAAARQGNPAAIGNMGRCYRYGTGVARDSVMAMRLYLRSIKEGNDTLLSAVVAGAEQDGVFDMVLLGLCRQKGAGMERDNGLAEAYFVQAAEKGSSDARREAALLCLNSGRKAEAAAWFQEAASQGDLPSVYYCGMLRMNGIGVEKDTVEGYSYLEKAAEQGFPQALYDLSGRYEKGRGVVRDAEKAAGLLRRAAAAGSSRAQWDYACRLRDGKGMERNFHLAASWMSLSLAGGDNYAFRRLYCNPAKPDTTAYACYLKGLMYAGRGDFDKAVACAEQIAGRGFGEGFALKGFALVRKSLAEKENNGETLRSAADCLNRVAETDDMAKVLLYTVSQMGGKVADSVSLLKKAADNGFPPALRLLGKAYYEGSESIGQDYGKAVDCFKKVDGQGMLDEQTAALYADCLLRGLGGLKADAEAAAAVKKRVRESGAMEAMLKRISEAFPD